VWTKPFIKLRLSHHRLVWREIDFVEELFHVLQHIFLAGKSPRATLGINAEGILAPLLLEKFLSGILAGGRKSRASASR
jgi:hypothetical protein